MPQPLLEPKCLVPLSPEAHNRTYVRQRLHSRGIGLSQCLLHSLRVVMHVTAINFVAQCYQRNDAARQETQAIVSVNHEACNAANSRDSFDAEPENPCEDDALLHIAEEEDTPKVENGINSPRGDEEHKHQVHPRSVTGDGVAYYSATEVGQRHREGHPDEKHKAANHQPARVVLRQLEHAKGAHPRIAIVFVLLMAGTLAVPHLWRTSCSTPARLRLEQARWQRRLHPRSEALRQKRLQ
eukprot:scaffold4037_cov400-Prasinococcus_capsulatus_cf.AAC.8